MANNVENWLRCNKCYRLMKKTGRTFSLTQCQHIFCDACVVNVEQQCPECNSRGVKTVSLAKPLPQPLQHYFGPVGSLVQQCLEASRFQRIQMVIALRRFDDIQGKYEDMKRLYYEGMQRAKALAVATKELREENATIAAEIEMLRAEESRDVRTSAESINFPRAAAANHRVPLSRLAMDYVSSQPGFPGWRSDISAPNSVSSSRSSIPSFIEDRDTRRHLGHQHVPHNACQNRPAIQGSGYRHGYVDANVALAYPPRVVCSRELSPNNRTPVRDMAWTRSNRIPGSLGELSNISSSGGTIRDSPTVDNYYLNFRRN